MENFIRKQKGLYPISEEGMTALLQEMEEISYLRGEMIVREGKREAYVYFVKSGLVRTYVVRDGKDVTLWFGSAGDMVFSASQGIAGVDIEALEDSVLLRIRQDKLEVLFEHSLELANWGRKLLDSYLSEYEHYFLTYSWTDAQEQYELLMKSYPELIQRVPLKHIASYLQITPQSLSRIRAKIKLTGH